jgi:hypothetical protein
MATQSSTGLADYLLVTGSLKSALDGGFIKVYSGTPPTTADDAVTGTLVWTISLGGAGTGLTWSPTTVSRALVKPTAATWSGPTAAGTATYFRVVGSADTGASSTTQPRVQGNVGMVAGSDTDMYVADTAFVVGTKSLSAFSLALPAVA